ncbi:hypothetical protein GUJ93_ZPchr0008g13319 [Zizania palustris]|uniref:Uncharacterized protein n=1 Tax=Zizania palustris TaxID=103762 RepID=A0A8J5RXV7_ZIZPA|nr:hypothetical protein GUJ93_ZPchr0008g13319 [Zizania palustris]
MKSIRKVAEFLKKAVGALRGKAGELRARLLFVASLRRRTAMVGVISQRLRALMPEKDGRGKAVAAAEDDEVGEQLALAGLRHDDDVGHSELAGLFQEVVDDDDGCPDWTHSLFDDDNDDDNGDEELEDEPSVIDVIRRRREGDGEEFNIEEEIDHAADMFIRRVRRHRMSTNRRSF